MADVEGEDAKRDHLAFVLNFFDALRRIAPAGSCRLAIAFAALPHEAIVAPAVECASASHHTLPEIHA